jgi:hypothetical protein
MTTLRKMTEVEEKAVNSYISTAYAKARATFPDRKESDEVVREYHRLMNEKMIAEGFRVKVA